MQGRAKEANNSSDNSNDNNNNHDSNNKDENEKNDANNLSMSTTIKNKQPTGKRQKAIFLSWLRFASVKHDCRNDNNNNDITTMKQWHNNNDITTMKQ